jgi:hypothetical protein
MIKRLIVIIFGLVISLFMVGCSGSGAPKSPVGSYAFGSTSFELCNKGSFSLEHVASGNETKHYTVTGTYTYTHDYTDKENEISYGKIDITVTSLSLDGSLVLNLDVTTTHLGTDISVGEKLPGWWKYMNLITYGGKMHLGLNLPFRGYRAETVDSGSDWLIIGDPK